MLGQLFGLVISVLKWTIFTVIVLVAGQLVHWRGRTVSDQVKSTLAHAQRWTEPAEELAGSMKNSARRLGDDYRRAEKISAEERARLKNLFSSQD